MLSPRAGDFEGSSTRSRRWSRSRTSSKCRRRPTTGFSKPTCPPSNGTSSGLQKVFQSVFPIRDFGETASLEFVKYELGEPKYDVDECVQRGMTFARPIKITVRLVVWDVDDEAGTRSIRDVKEQEVYFGEIPVMTDNGTFIVNGTERVIVNQLHRSPGVFFSHDEGKKHSSGKFLLLRAGDPLPGVVARLRVQPQGPPVRAHRPAPQVERHGAAQGPRVLPPGDPRPLLREDGRPGERGRRARPTRRSGSTCSRTPGPRRTSSTRTPGRCSSRSSAR